jgi:hypothetical protein
LYEKEVTMLIRACFDCEFHRMKQEGEIQMSYCSKENCWAAYSDCITLKALDRFLKDESKVAFVKNITPQNLS